MLFHITAQHDHLTCGGVKARKEGRTDYQKESGRWMEGNDKVKVIAVFLNQPHHRVCLAKPSLQEGIQSSFGSIASFLNQSFYGRYSSHHK